MVFDCHTIMKIIALDEKKYLANALIPFQTPVWWVLWNVQRHKKQLLCQVPCFLQQIPHQTSPSQNLCLHKLPVKVNITCLASAKQEQLSVNWSNCLCCQALNFTCFFFPFQYIDHKLHSVTKLMSRLLDQPSIILFSIECSNFIKKITIKGC